MFAAIQEDRAELARTQQRTVPPRRSAARTCPALQIRRLAGLAERGHEHSVQREEFHLRLSLDAKLLDYGARRFSMKVLNACSDSHTSVTCRPSSANPDRWSSPRPLPGLVLAGDRGHAAATALDGPAHDPHLLDEPFPAPANPFPRHDSLPGVYELHLKDGPGSARPAIVGVWLRWAHPLAIGQVRPSPQARDEPQERVASTRQYRRQRGPWRASTWKTSRTLGSAFCRGDIEKHVEVKGTTTDGAEVILTPDEVRHPQERPCTALFRPEQRHNRAG